MYQKKQPNTLRVIGGKWRGRKVHFANEAPIRPTLDHVRETLFNWLQTSIVGAKCLDAFAGSGALGMEALSRGAETVTFVDKNQAALANIRHHLTLFEARNYDCLACSLPDDLAYLPKHGYDIIFLDPPFHGDLLNKTLCALAKSSLVHAATLIYVETKADHALSASVEFDILRQKKTKHLFYGLIRLSSEK